ncbi:thioredoxin family protein [Brevibacillus sp. H7]|uniref:thioredoxin family protein n=1 Tax=Brevibacillus sp. H7 TaxID=3349138 RepID=UPI003803FBD8
MTLKDPLYGNQILADELAAKINNNESFYVYFYSPTCKHCKAATPVIVDVAKKQQINVMKHNLLEFESSWGTYHIDKTPTLVFFKNGKESHRLIGAVSELEFETFFSNTSIIK